VLPFVGLAALIALPFWYGGKALWKRAGAMKTWLRNVALLLAAPFLGLAYVIALPFVGIILLFVAIMFVFPEIIAWLPSKVA